MVSPIFSPLDLTDEDPVALLLSSMRSSHTLTLSRHYLSAEGTIHRLADDTPADIIRLFYSDSLPMRYTDVDNIDNFHKDAYATLNCLLLDALEADPSRLETPEARTAVAVAALSAPQPEDALQSWVARMADGPVCLYGRHIPLRDMLPSSKNPTPSSELNHHFFLRWDERLGSRLIPTMDINTYFLDALSEQSLCQLFQRIRFTGSPTRGELSHMAKLAIQQIKDDAFLRKLMQPGELLSLEDPATLLDAFYALPPDRRNALLPYLRKNPDYSL